MRRLRLGRGLRPRGAVPARRVERAPLRGHDLSAVPLPLRRDLAVLLREAARARRVRARACAQVRPARGGSLLPRARLRRTPRRHAADGVRARPHRSRVDVRRASLPALPSADAGLAGAGDSRRLLAAAGAHAGAGRADAGRAGEPRVRPRLRDGSVLDRRQHLRLDRPPLHARRPQSLRRHRRQPERARVHPGRRHGASRHPDRRIRPHDPREAPRLGARADPPRGGRRACRARPASAYRCTAASSGISGAAAPSSRAG